jgi:hypothetical protein
LKEEEEVVGECFVRSRGDVDVDGGGGVDEDVLLV